LNFKTNFDRTLEQFLEIFRQIFSNIGAKKQVPIEIAEIDIGFFRVCGFVYHA
jgi:hypothetical protein